MQLPLQIVFRNLGPSDAVREMVEDWVNRLERHHGAGTLESCRVAVERRQHRHDYSHFQVRVSVKTRDDQVVANRDTEKDQTHEDVYMAIHDAFDSVRRQLDEQIATYREDKGRENKGRLELDG